MRPLFVFGFIALYIAFAFVPPSQANVRAMAKQVQKISVSGTSPVATVADAIKAVSNSAPHAKATVGDLLHAMTSNTVASTTLGALGNAGVRSSIRTQLERIQWAASKADPRLCKSLGESQADTRTEGEPAFGQLLALCLARTTGEVGRCNSIDDSALHAACVQGLDTLSTTLL